MNLQFPVSSCDSLAARVLWRMHKDTGIASDSQLISVDQLQEHVADLAAEDFKQLRADVHKFLQYWSYGMRQHSVDYISHIFGIVSVSSLITKSNILALPLLLLTLPAICVCSCRSSVMDSP